MKSKSIAIRTAFAVLASASFVTSLAHSSTFYSLVDSNATCGAIPINGGKQYTQGYPTNGVPQDSWSALYRWQGQLGSPGSYADWQMSAFTPVLWDIGRYTGLTVTPPNWWTTTQMGRVGQQYPSFDPSDYAMPGVQAYCGQAGMLMNTWWTPHIPVVGGTPNDMFGYAWSTSNQPLAFKQGSENAELVLEANVAMTGWAPYAVTSDAYAGAYIALFVYLRDTTDASRPAFGVLAAVHGTGNQSSYLANGIGPTLDYCNSASDCGGWFVSAPITSASGESPPNKPSAEKWITIRNNITGKLSSTETQVHWSPFFDQNNIPAEQYFRVHITRSNLKNMVDQFNSVSCPAAHCPRGYSDNPDHYKVEYAGVIMELLHGNQWGIDWAYSRPYPWYDGYWTENDANKDQVAVAGRMSSVRVSRYVP